MRLREIRSFLGQRVELTTFNARFVGAVYNVTHDDRTGADRIDIADCYKLRPGKIEYHDTKSLMASTISEVRPL